MANSTYQTYIDVAIALLIATSAIVSAQKAVIVKTISDKSLFAKVVRERNSPVFGFIILIYSIPVLLSCVMYTLLYNRVKFPNSKMMMSKVEPVKSEKG